MRKRIHKIIGLGLIAGLLMITGCWDSKEVENLAVVNLIGWDKVTVDGEELWQISTRILDMGEQQSNGGGGNTSAQELLIVGTGLTAHEAFNNMVKRLPASFFEEHNVAIIIGERVAREELPNAISNALRYSRSRIRVDIFVCQGEAYKILQTQPELSSILSKEIRKIAERTAEKSGASPKMTVLDFSKHLVRRDRDSVLPLIKVYDKQEGEVTPEKSLEIEGFGVIRDTKLVGWLKEEDALAYILSVSNPRNPEIPLVLTYVDRKVSYSILNTKGRVSAKLVDGKPKYLIRIKTEGVVHETDIPLLTSEESQPLQRAIEERILDMTEKMVKKAREYDADIFGFNEYLHRYHPRDWETIEPNWREHFQKAEIEIEVESVIKAFGTANEGFDFYD